LIIHILKANMHNKTEYKGGHQTRILVDRRRALGDLVMITPVLRELRKRYPDAWLQVVTEEPGVLHNNPHVSAVVKPADMQKADPWDVYVNLNDAYEEQVTSHYVDSYLYRAFGAQGLELDHSPEIFPTEEEQQNVQDVLQQIGSNYVVVHMRRWAWENKNIDMEIWSALFTRLHDKYPGLKIVAVGAQYDYHVPAEPEKFIDLVGQLSIGEIQHLISQARAFIGPDSGPFHIAGTTATPIVALISHLLPEQILPTRSGVFGKDVTVVTSDVSCLGCYARQKPPVRELVCENETKFVCSKSFDNMKIFNALEHILDDK
jgi:ADP-heptose:LPS heptosyltransferase